MRRIAGLIFVAMSAACASQPQRNEGQDRAAVSNIRLEFEAGENAGDLGRMTRNLAADVVAMPPNRPITTGAAFTEALRGFLAAYSVDVKYTTDELVLAGRSTAVAAATLIHHAKNTCEL